MPKQRLRPTTTAARLVVRRKRWRDYHTATGGHPVKDFLRGLPLTEYVEIDAAMRDVRDGIDTGKHIRGDIFEVRATGRQNIYRILFSHEGKHKHILLAVHAFIKKTQQLDEDDIRLAVRRLVDWRQRGRALKAAIKRRN